WPLGRMPYSKSLWQLTVEKLPLAGLSLASAAITFILQIHTHESVGQLPLSWRLQNALVTYVTYIWQIFWPANLAIFYPHPDDRLALWRVALSAMFLIAITWIVLALRRNRPYPLGGWPWHLLILLPLIGIVESGRAG